MAIDSDALVAAVRDALEGVQNPRTGEDVVASHQDAAPERPASADGALERGGIGTRDVVARLQHVAIRPAQAVAQGEACLGVAEQMAQGGLFAGPAEPKPD